jgi:RHS repeat-associated protein
MKLHIRQAVARFSVCAFTLLSLLACMLSLSLLSPTFAHAAKKTVHFYNDISGSPQLAVDADSGQVLWKETYKPYGERINNSPASASGQGNNQLYFHGKQQEALNGGVTIQYFGARYYDPSIGRFMGVDPVHFIPPNVHSFNRFAYGNNNPYRYKDPDGNIPIDTILDVGSIIWDAGRGLGAAAAYAHGAITGNQSLKAVAGEGLRETGVDLGLSVGAALTPYVSAGMVKGGIKLVDDRTGHEIGRFIADKRGNVMIEPKGGSTVAAGKGGVDTHTLYPNGSNYQRLNPQGHSTNSTPHAHGHAQGTGSGRAGQGASLDTKGSVVSPKSDAAHWPIN